MDWLLFEVSTSCAYKIIQLPETEVQKNNIFVSPPLHLYQEKNSGGFLVVDVSKKEK